MSKAERDETALDLTVTGGKPRHISVRGGAEPPTECDTDLVLVPFCKDSTPTPHFDAVQEALGIDLRRFLAANQVNGEVGDLLVVPTLGKIRPRAVGLVGVGGGSDLGAGTTRNAAMRVAPLVSGFTSVATVVHQIASSPDAVDAFVEGFFLGAYRFDRYRTAAAASGPSILRILGDAATVRPNQLAWLSADTANWARELVNMPASDANPKYVEEQALRFAREGDIDARVLQAAELERDGYGGIVAVGKGSAHAPRLIELTYRGDGDAAPLALVGKGVTFDSGGINVKPFENMVWMKADMGGAAAVLAVMRALAQLKPRINVVAVVPVVENMPGPSAYRPGDVVRHRGGMTSEIVNTDAEGRLILADALAHVAELKPSAIIDCATLTNWILGSETFMIFGTDQALVAEILDAGAATGEAGWQMPLLDASLPSIRSEIADLKQADPDQRSTDPINAALYLRQFVGDIPWAHIDVIGTAFLRRPSRFWPAGATGSPARLILRFLERRARQDPAA